MEKITVGIDVAKDHLDVAPNSLVATVNHERMPLLLTRGAEFDIWLRASLDEAIALAREHPAEGTRIAQVSSKKTGSPLKRGPKSQHCRRRRRGRSSDPGEITSAVKQSLAPRRRPCPGMSRCVSQICTC
jgi:hypothetical protein